MDIELKLIKQIKKQTSKEAGNQLVSYYYKEIYAYIFKQTINKELSMDLTQEVFISMLQSIATFDEKKASFRTWLYKLATYRIVDYYRSKNYQYTLQVTTLDENEYETTSDFMEDLEKKLEVESVLTVVNKLDGVSQQIFRLKIFGEYTFSEIAASIHISESTVKTKYYSIIRKLRAIVEEDEYAKRKASY